MDRWSFGQHAVGALRITKPTPPKKPAECGINGAKSQAARTGLRADL
jgi:hypothetical protein